MVTLPLLEVSEVCVNLLYKGMYIYIYIYMHKG